MILTGKQVAIIGGGPAGLTLARLLQMRGEKVTVYERDAGPFVRQQGATLDLHEESGLKALSAAGLMDAFKANHRPDAGKMRVVDKHLQIHIDDHASGGGHSEDRPEIDRGPLRDLLIDSLEPGTVVWDSQFVSMEKKKGAPGWVVSFKNGKTASADLVIAADGANSKLRPYLTAIKPVYAGITIVEGKIEDAAVNAPKMWALAKGGKVFILDDEKSVITTAKGDGTLTYYTGCKVEQQWATKGNIDFANPSSVAGWFRETFGDWHPDLFELVGCDNLSVVPRTMYYFPLDQCWESQPDLTLLGDAAHRMPPYAGEGVNTAMLDALVLADALTDQGYKETREAIASYEREMLERAAIITQMSLDNTVLLHGPDAIRQMEQVLEGDD